MRFAAPALFVAMSLATSVAAADKGGDAKERCATAFERAQIEQRQGRLRSASDLMRVCVAAECPAVLRADCDAGAKELDALTPSIVVRVTAATGDVVGATASLDDGPFAPLDGRAATLDPGPHRVRIRAEGFDDVERAIVVEERIKGRVVEVRLAETAAPASPPPSRVLPQALPPAAHDGPARTGTKIAAATLGGVGVLSLGGFVALGLGASADYRRLERECAGACAKADTDAVRDRMQVADVALVVGGAFLVGSALVYLFGPRAAASEAAPHASRESSRQVISAHVPRRIGGPQ